MHHAKDNKIRGSDTCTSIDAWCCSIDASAASFKHGSTIGNSTVELLRHAMSRITAGDALIRQGLVHANISFLAAENPFFHLFLDTIRPSYTAPSQYVLSHNLLDSECVRVQQEDIDRLKGHTKLTLLLDGWEDCLKQILYGSVAVEVNRHPVILALEDMTGNRGYADNLLAVTKKAMVKMEISDEKSVVAITTDNPTVMQAYCWKFQENFPWVMVTSHLYKMNFCWIFVDICMLPP